MTDENENKVPSNLTFKYSWGTERPGERFKRLQKAREKAIYDRNRLQDHYALLMGAKERELSLIEAELTQLEFLAPGGRYDSEREAQLSNLIRHLSPDGQLITSAPPSVVGRRSRCLSELGKAGPKNCNFFVPQGARFILSSSSGFRYNSICKSLAAKD
ncbi:hypothetical protein ACFOYU_04785 [Microvirga sp. GCM10011540]|uniref:hypothetical protein n=1 Tax=Microvirga sp. GCM10011540 TaxID=3317338 RepID=UPI0036218432